LDTKSRQQAHFIDLTASGRTAGRIRCTIHRKVPAACRLFLGMGIEQSYPRGGA
jgi:hypothetical protein